MVHQSSKNSLSFSARVKQFPPKMPLYSSEFKASLFTYFNQKCEEPISRLEDLAQLSGTAPRVPKPTDTFAPPKRSQWSAWAGRSSLGGVPMLGVTPYLSIWSLTEVFPLLGCASEMMYAPSASDRGSRQTPSVSLSPWKQSRPWAS